MGTFEIFTQVKAPPEVCFDLARDIDFHTLSLQHTSEKAVAGRTSGLIELGETVTWEARHFGVRQRLTVKITELERPRFFRDEMIRGAFRMFVHDHTFVSRDDGTRMVDRITFHLPLGIVGSMMDWLVMSRYLRRLVEQRVRAIRDEAENRARTESSG